MLHNKIKIAAPPVIIARDRLKGPRNSPFLNSAKWSAIAAARWKRTFSHKIGVFLAQTTPKLMRYKAKVFGYGLSVVTAVAASAAILSAVCPVTKQQQASRTSTSN